MSKFANGLCEKSGWSEKTFAFKNYGIEVVAIAQNNATFINGVANKILSDTWTELCQDINEPLK